MNRLLYLHGFASGPDSTKAQFLRERFAGLGIALEIPDLNGGDLEHLTLSRQLGVLERAACGEPVSLIGSSLGGYLAALYAARHPEVERLLLLAPAFGFADRLLEYVGPEQVKEWQRTGWVTIHDDRQARVWYGLIEDARQYEAFPATTQPVLILHGARDADVPYRLSQEFARRRADVTLKLLDSGHDLLDQLERIWGAARVFFG